MSAGDWRETNRSRWDELVGVHLAPGGYDMDALRGGRSRLDRIVAGELGDVSGLRLLHLQCHFGWDTLTLARQGADMVGLDFSTKAIDAARDLADALGLATRARFVAADLYDAPVAVPQPHGFDGVFASWGAINWLPDIGRWGAVVAAMLRPGGFAYLADQHPSAFVFDDATAGADGNPGFFAPYFSTAPLVMTNVPDYKNPAAPLRHTTEHVFAHPLGAVVAALLDAGLTLDFLHEHDSITWPMFKCLVRHPDGLYRWPDRTWLPLAFSIRARKPLV